MNGIQGTNRRLENGTSNEHKEILILTYHHGTFMTTKILSIDIF